MKINHSDTSSLVEIRAKLPFGLDAEPQNGSITVTKSNSNGAEVGDKLLYCSHFTMGLPRGDGIITTVGSFGGAIGWQCSMFDVRRARSFEEVIEALTSNVEGRTDECVMIFEREN
ncbi:hypothetical protein TL16_g01539 [Triparma laevis f. inornata]|uniref:Uncharacterized protein n=2 Tax=Triparma laevis TaxID=1534972 RepID=A0A9W7E7D9_9STRA|nr:hypothetical protein TL16_g01539 [Triparma laevis f. inornata]GMH68717.1 hypothetical protein TrLO_g1799 [Triparma laevis f. longispina]